MVSKSAPSPAPLPEASPTTSSSKDDRLKITLSDSAPRLLAMKADLERVEGRKLTWDEAIRMMVGYVEVSSPDAVSIEVAQRLKALAAYLEEHRDEDAASIVSLFRESMLDVLRGKLEARRLSEALVDVQ